MERYTVESLDVERTPPASSVQNAPAAPHVTAVPARKLKFTLDGGSFEGRLQGADTPGDAAVLWVFGSGGGLGGPAGGVYLRLGAALATRGVASLELDYRKLRDLPSCVEDVGVGIEHLESLGRRRIVMVGHSFGGRVVIEAAARSSSVIAVCAMSSVDVEAGAVERLEPRPLLLIHGEQDEVIPHSVSLSLFKRAGAGKQLLLYPGCGHGLDQCGSAIDRDLAAWIGAELDLDGA